MTDERYEGNRPDDEVVDEVVDLEAYAKAGKKPPRARAYKFKVNDDVFEWPKPFITGREALTLGGLTPPENFTLRVKILGQKPEKVELDRKVDLRAPGTEKFRAIRKEQTDGEYVERRDAPLLDADRSFLDSYGLPYDVIQDGSTWVILREFSLPNGLAPERVSVAVRLEQGYPLAELDMMYVFPAASRADAKAIPQTEVRQRIEGVDYQRWSRHRTAANPWVPNKDSLETHIYLIEEWIAQELSR